MKKRKKPEASNSIASQQGFILALALLMMLFVGIVVITSTERTGIEQRVATSELHSASAQSAAEAGLFHLQKKLSCTSSSCADDLSKSFNKLSGLRDLLDLEQDIKGAGVLGSRRTYDAENQLYWWIPVQCPEVTGQSFPVIVYGEVGEDADNPRQRVAVSAHIKINNGGGGVLSDLFGEFSAITQAANLKGSGKIYGDVAAVSEPDIKGGSTFDGNYSEITADDYNAHRSIVNSYFDTFAALGYSDGSLNKVPGLGGYPFQQSKIGLLDDDAPVSEGNPFGWHGFNQTWNINAWQQFNLTVHENQEFMGQNVRVIPLSELNIASDAQVVVKGGNVVLYVDGDVNLAGNARFTIGSKSSLTLVMTGQFTLQGSFSFAYLDEDTGVVTTGSQMSDRVLNKNGYPIFSVYTSYMQSGNNDQGVRVQGNTNLYGVIYAAHSDVRVTGSGDIWGSVFGNNVDVEGNASIQFATDGLAGSPTPALDTKFDYDFPESSIQCTATP